MVGAFGYDIGEAGEPSDCLGRAATHTAITPRTSTGEPSMAGWLRVVGLFEG